MPEILVPLDGSSAAEAALPYAEAVATAMGASLRLFGVVEPEDTGRPIWSVEVGERADREQAQHAALLQTLTDVAAALRERGFVAEVTVARGDPADEIVAAADERMAAMVVMATHGRGGIDRLLVGSVADKVMRMCTRPVLLVRPPAAAERAPAPALRRLMVPLDGSPLAESALPLAAELAAAAGATLTLVRVEPFTTVGATPTAAPIDVAGIEEARAAAAESYLGEVHQRLPAGLRVERRVLRGVPSETLIRFAQQENVDLVVMSTHGRGGLRRLVLGSTADRLVRAGVPTLLVRSAGPAAGRAAHAQPAAPTAWHCATCGRLITAVPAMEARCPRCGTHLHHCSNCVFWDSTGCVLQRPEAYRLAWPGRDCPRFIFRETPARPDAPHLIERGAVR